MNTESINSLREALAHVIANERREWRRERELIEAQARETVAELRAKIIEIERDLTQTVAERLNAVRDGLDGKDGRDGAPGERGIDGKDGRDGVDGKDGIDGAAGRDGIDGKDGLNGDPGVNGRDGIDGKDGDRGPQGLEGIAGAPGKLPIIRAWEDEIHYQGDVVAHDGATYQASRDTGRAPPHEDWICLASAGRNGLDGRSFEITGTYKPDGEYRSLNVVALNGGAFIARRDDPGPCPGEGWQLIAGQGKQGKPGDRGPSGPKGDRGLAGPAVSGLEVDGDGLFRLKNADGSVVDVDLYPILSRLG